MHALDYRHANAEEEFPSAEADKKVEQSRTAEVQMISINYTCLYNLINQSPELLF